MEGGRSALDVSSQAEHAGGTTLPPAFVRSGYFSLATWRDVVLKQGQVHNRLVLEEVLQPPRRSRLSISSTSRFSANVCPFMILSLAAHSRAASTIEHLEHES